MNSETQGKYRPFKKILINTLNTLMLWLIDLQYMTSVFLKFFISKRYHWSNVVEYVKVELVWISSFVRLLDLHNLLLISCLKTHKPDIRQEYNVLSRLDRQLDCLLINLLEIIMKCIGKMYQKYIISCRLLAGIIKTSKLCGL